MIDSKKITKKFAKSTKDIKVSIPFARLYFLGITLTAFITIFPVLISKIMPPEVPVFYGYPEGEKQIGARSSLMIPGSVAIFFSLINAFAAYFSGDQFVKQLLIGASLILMVLSSITTIRIILLVGAI